MLTSPPARATKQEIMDRARAMAPRFTDRAGAAEEARRIPQESVRDMLEAGFARILIPKESGGYGLGFDTWFEVTRELSKADASHGWCASLIIHHNHLIAQYPEAAQKALWASGLDVPIAVSLVPVVQAITVEGGYRISGKGSPFVSGVDHCTWVMLSGLARGGGASAAPDWKFFLVPPGDYTIRDTWFTAGMCATGSKTVVVDNAYVPNDLVLKLADLRDGRTPGGVKYRDALFHTPYSYYAPIAVATPMLGAAQGAYEHFCKWTNTRKAQDGSAVAAKTSVQVRMARAAADLDAADLLLRRAVNVTNRPQDYSPKHLTRSLRDFARVSEWTVGVIDTLLSLSGTAAFDTSHPLQRAWRDIHFMSTHSAVASEKNLAHFGHMELGAGRPI
jgi:3-hydroxy-9,10-secoandrosta-1,3,5(10)-triene-9,17-dione monooxygenase